MEGALHYGRNALRRAVERWSGGFLFACTAVFERARAHAHRSTEFTAWIRYFPIAIIIARFYALFFRPVCLIA
jgi:hypothetical protein